MKCLILQGGATERLNKRIGRVTGLDIELRAKLSSSEHLQVSQSTGLSAQVRVLG